MFHAKIWNKVYKDQLVNRGFELEGLIEEPFSSASTKSMPRIKSNGCMFIKREVHSSAMNKSQGF